MLLAGFPRLVRRAHEIKTRHTPFAFALEAELRSASPDLQRRSVPCIRRPTFQVLYRPHIAKVRGWRAIDLHLKRGPSAGNTRRPSLLGTFLYLVRCATFTRSCRTLQLAESPSYSLSGALLAFAFDPCAQRVSDNRHHRDATHFCTVSFLPTG